MAKQFRIVVQAFGAGTAVAGEQEARERRGQHHRIAHHDVGRSMADLVLAPRHRHHAHRAPPQNGRLGRQANATAPGRFESYEAKDIDAGIRTDWYGVYLKDKKIGYFGTTRSKNDKYYMESFSMTMKVITLPLDSLV